MKHLTTLLILLLVCSWSHRTRAQVADHWVTVSPAGERFTIQLPSGHVVKSVKNSVDQFKFDGNIYTATSDGVDYTVWSLVNEDYDSMGRPDNAAYLDASADLVWESLLKPLREQLPKSPEVASYMSYQRELESPRLPPGREYTITLGNRSGVTHFYVAGRQIYVLTGLKADANSAGTQRFLNSFGLNTPGLPVAATIQADPKLFPPSASGGADAGVGPGRGGNTGGGPSTGAGDPTDYNRVFAGREVTGKARILSKPEPSYSESARRYSVQGTVILRAVLSREGEVLAIRVVKRQPHGLTERAIGAARNIRFVPASKDGHAVSMHIQLEYNFNLF